MGVCDNMLSLSFGIRQLSRYRIDLVDFNELKGVFIKRLLVVLKAAELLEPVEL